MEVRLTLLIDSVCFGATGPGLSIDVGDDGAHLVILFKPHSSRAGACCAGKIQDSLLLPDSSSRVRRKTETKQQRVEWGCPCHPIP